MNFESPIVYGILLKRYKRFLADIRLDNGQEITAHCPNPGAMVGIKEPGLRVGLTISANKSRKLPYSWQMVECNGVWLGMNTQNPNKIIAEALSNKQIKAFSDYKNIKPEVKYGENSRIDFLLSDGPTPLCFLEVKNVHLVREQGLAEFPDCVTARGAKHQLELAKQVESGHRAAVVYVVQRQDVQSFKIAADYDPAYATAVAKAKHAGVEVYAYACHVSASGITLAQELTCF